MFSFFKKKNINLALKYCQEHHKKIGLGQELSQEMLDMVTQTPLFKDIDNRFSGMGISHYGGLAWFSSEIVGTISKQVKEGQEVSEDMYLLAEKMATVSLLLANSIHSLKLTKNDLAAILNTGEIAKEWLDLTRTPEQEKFMAEMFAR
ncbi:hypothetical protein [Pseudoalteromonas undina]|uniref:hypothetical protein n=1 Tax=Pseudoalteromonas undina TaxID=43660 RepID=UPI001865A720|nr:hypothetical protein [Pseudoalteromonas undina]